MAALQLARQTHLQGLSATTKLLTAGPPSPLKWLNRSPPNRRARSEATRAPLRHIAGVSEASQAPLWLQHATQALCCTPLQKCTAAWQQAVQCTLVSAGLSEQSRLCSVVHTSCRLWISGGLQPEIFSWATAVMVARLPGSATGSTSSDARSLAVNFGSGVRHLYFQLHQAGASEQGERDTSCAVFVSGLPFSEAPLASWLTELLQPFGTVQQAAVHPSQVRPTPAAGQGVRDSC